MSKAPGMVRHSWRRSCPPVFLFPRRRGLRDPWIHHAYVNRFDSLELDATPSKNIEILIDELRLCLDPRCSIAPWRVIYTAWCRSNLLRGINANDELSSVEFVTGGEAVLPNRSAHLIVYLEYCYVSVYTRVD